MVLLEARSPTLRPDYTDYSTYSDTNSEVVIVIMKDSGDIKRGYNINMQSASVSLNLAEHSAFMLGDHYVFGGQSYGYYTKMQNVTYDVSAPTLDTFVFKYNPSDASCLY